MTPLVVRGDAAFQSDVLAALGEICPCVSYTLAQTGNVVADSSASSCRCYCWNRAGCNLLSTLIHAPKRVSIDISLGGPSYNWKNDVVKYNPTHTQMGLNRCGDKTTRPSVELAHELIHAYHELQEEFTELPSRAEEFATVRGENQIRRAMCEPQRTKYSASDVPNYSGADLPIDDRMGCDRHAVGRSLGNIVDQVVCGLQLGARCVSSIVRRSIARRECVGPIMGFESGNVEDLFARMVVRADPDLKDRFQDALATRARAPHRRYVKQLIASFDRLRCGLLVEGVDLDGDYRVILIMVATADVRAVTNIHLLRDEEQERETPGSEQRPKLFARGPSHLTEYVLAGNQGDVVAQEVAGVEFDAGIGGKKTLLDGTVQFLTVKREGRPSIQTALYGYEYPAFDGSWDEPEGIDLPRWNAVVLAYDVWRRLMKQHMESIRVVAPGEVQPS